MQNFSTKEIRHDFTVDGAPYFLPGVTIGDYEEVGKLASMETDEQIVAFRQLLATRAKTPNVWAFWRKHPRAAVSSLSPKQLTALFTAWTGFGKSVGESSSSPESV